VIGGEIAEARRRHRHNSALLTEQEERLRAEAEGDGDDGASAESAEEPEEQRGEQANAKGRAPARGAGEEAQEEAEVDESPLIAGDEDFPGVEWEPIEQVAQGAKRPAAQAAGPKQKPRAAKASKQTQADAEEQPRQAMTASGRILFPRMSTPGGVRGPVDTAAIAPTTVPAPAMAPVFTQHHVHYHCPVAPGWGASPPYVDALRLSVADRHLLQ
jgi:hypothetical protein